MVAWAPALSMDARALHGACGDGGVARHAEASRTGPAVTHAGTGRGQSLLKHWHNGPEETMTTRTRPGAGAASPARHPLPATRGCAARPDHAGDASLSSSSRPCRPAGHDPPGGATGPGGITGPQPRRRRPPAATPPASPADWYPRHQVPIEQRSNTKGAWYSDWL